VSEDGNAFGRPVGVAIDKSGALLVADDVGHTVWRVAAAKKNKRRLAKKILRTQIIVPAGWPNPLHDAIGSPVQKIPVRNNIQS
jgi:hypothetical protein